MRILLALLCIGALSANKIQAQSLEVMPGSERLFVDVQWLKTFDGERRWSLFSRTRATVDYENTTGLYFGNFVNYTGKTGLGASLIGSATATGAKSELGVHYFKMSKNVMVFALAYYELSNTVSYSVFSITRYRPEISERLKLYTSLELYSNFRKADHNISFQGLRLGLEKKTVQFGLALNYYQTGNELNTLLVNPGLFVRKEF